MTTGTRDPETMSLGVLFGFLDLFKLYDQLLTLSSNAAFMTGYPAYKRNAPPGASMASAIGAGAGPTVAPFGIDGGERDAQRPVQVVPGEVLPFDVSPVEPPRTGMDLQKAGEQVQGILNRVLPPALTGQDTGTSGYQLNQSAYLGALRYSPILKNGEIALGQRVSFESWLIENRVGETVYAWGEVPQVTPRRGYNPGARGTREGWLGVGPDDLKGAHRYRVALDAEVPSNKVLEVRTQVEMLQAGLTSRTQAMEEFGQDPGAVERQLLVENMKRTPEVQKRLQDRIFQLLGMGEEQQLAELGGPPTGPAPGMEGAGPPGGVAPRPGRAGDGRPGRLPARPERDAPGPAPARLRHRHGVDRPGDGARRPPGQPRRRPGGDAGPARQHAAPARRRPLGAWTRPPAAPEALTGPPARSRPPPLIHPSGGARGLRGRAGGRPAGGHDRAPAHPRQGDARPATGSAAGRGRRAACPGSRPDSLESVADDVAYWIETDRARGGPVDDGRRVRPVLGPHLPAGAGPLLRRDPVHPPGPARPGGLGQGVRPAGAGGPLAGHQRRVRLPPIAGAARPAARSRGSSPRGRTWWG